MLELATMMLGMTGSRSRIVHRPLPEDDPGSGGPDISKALGWAPRAQLRRGLARTIEYIDRLLRDETVRVRVVTAA